jgi:hypothetical protein
MTSKTKNIHILNHTNENKNGINDVKHKPMIKSMIHWAYFSDTLKNILFNLVNKIELKFRNVIIVLLNQK